MTLKDQLLAVARAYTAATGRSLARVATIVRNDGKFFYRLAAGGDCGTGVYELCMAWFAAHWPVGAPWPDGVADPREDKQKESAESTEGAAA